MLSNIPWLGHLPRPPPPTPIESSCEINNCYRHDTMPVLGAFLPIVTAPKSYTTLIKFKTESVSLSWFIGLHHLKFVG